MGIAQKLAQLPLLSGSLFRIAFLAVALALWIGLPVALSALGMMAAHALIHVPVPSVSGQAVLTLPVLVPLSDLLGLSRQVTVLAYQYGAGLTDLLAPTNRALMAILAAARVRYEEWLRFVLPMYAVLAGLGVVAILVGIATGLR